MNKLQFYNTNNLVVKTNIPIKWLCSLFLIQLMNLHVYSQNLEYEFINEVILPFEKENPIPVDTIFLKNEFLISGKHFTKVENFNKDLIRLWWGAYNIPPIELFFDHFDLLHFQSEVKKSQNDSLINFKKLNSYFFSVNNKYIERNPQNKYLSISKPYFNQKKDWCMIIKSEYIPLTNTGGSGILLIYVKVDNKWILYNKINLWLS